jgi:hypothetical protein
MRGERTEQVTTDEGNSFIEILISIALMGTVVVTLLYAMETTIRLSKISDDQAKVESVIGSAADRVANFAYKPCPGFDGDDRYLSIAQAAAPAVGWTGSTVTIDEVRFWDPDTQSWEPSNGLDETLCNSSISLTDSRTLQKVRIRVTSPGGSHSRTTDVVKANFRPDEIKDQTNG